MFAERLRSKLAGICEVSDEQVQRLEEHYALLMRWNQRLNLTGLRTEEEIVERHYCESVFAAQQLPATVGSIADVGSGAGFPGIPIAIMRPGSTVTLIESHQRKAVFLKEVSRELGNVRVLARRVEDVAERFDWTISRAVLYEDIAASLRRLAENVELLGGEMATLKMPQFEWREPIRLPWGEHRYLWIGSAVGRA